MLPATASFCPSATFPLQAFSPCKVLRESESILCHTILWVARGRNPGKSKSILRSVCPVGTVAPEIAQIGGKIDGRPRNLTDNDPNDDPNDANLGLISLT